MLGGISKEEVTMQIEYSPDADVLIVKLRDSEIVDSIDVAEGVIVHLDEEGKVVEIEILDASKTVEFDKILLSGLQVAKS